MSLRRLRSAALIANFVPEVAQAVRAFDRALPALREMRNVGEHIDAYAVDDPKRFHKEIGRRDLQVGTWDGTTSSWLTGGLNIDDALRAAELLFQAIRTANERAAAMRRNDA